MSDKHVIEEAAEAVKKKSEEGKNVAPMQDKPEPSDKVSIDHKGTH